VDVSARLSDAEAPSDLRGLSNIGLVARRVGYVILVAVAVVALLKVFGQRPSTTTAHTSAARLDVIIFEDGKPVERNLRRETPDRRGDCRSGASAADRVAPGGEVGVLETSGQIAFIKKGVDGS
jgi:hypothetical protein